MQCWDALGLVLRLPLPTCVAAQFYRYSGTDIVKAWSAICFSWKANRHWKHGLWPQIGMFFFFAFEVAKSKEQSMETSRNANCNSHLYDVDGCSPGAEMRLISSHHKQPQNGNCCHLTFIHYQPHQNWWLVPNYRCRKDISEKYKKRTTHTSLQTLLWPTRLF